MPNSSLRRSAEERLARLDRLLDDAYGAPEHLLGNKSDPLDEAVYIVLSLQTDLARTAATWARLRAAFPTWDRLASARADRVARILRESGLHRQKARTLKRLLAHVQELTGTFSLDWLRDMPDGEAERFLVRLPGFSWKTARCVLLYSLNRDVFPVDSNTFRILRRAGVLGPKAVYRRRPLHDALQGAVPPDRRRAFHVNLVIHGQRTCLPRAPHCATCAARPACAMRGLPVRPAREAISPHLPRAS
jgi:endonuclease-3